MGNVILNVFKTHQDAVLPSIAYSGTSAAFDLYAVEDVQINPGESKVVPNGLRISIDENDPYCMVIWDRSSMGFKRNLRVFQGLVDAGYCGDLGVRIDNIGSEVEIIHKGDKYAQILVLPKTNVDFNIIETQEDFNAYEAKQQRGSKGFGSSGK